MISVIIPVKNNITTIGNCIRGILAQYTNEETEIIVIDSGSTDGSLNIIRSFVEVSDSIFLKQIRPEDFGHGKTRNYGASLAKGEFLVFLNADVIPVDSYWLENLLKNFSFNYSCAAGVYSRWLPKPNCDPLELEFVQRTFSSIKEVRTLEIIYDEFTIYKGRFILFSTASCMIQRAVWEKIPFNDMALIGEDQEWSKAALQAGYTIIYEPASLVYHSHNYSLKARLRRSFDSGASTITWETNSLFHWYMIPFHVFSNCAGAFLFMHGKSGCLKWTFKAMIASLVTDTGLLLGINHKRLPHNLVRRLTSIPHSPVFQRKGG